GLAAPEALYGPLREQSAVARSEAYGGFYAVLRHAELQQVMSDPATWSAAQGVIIPRNPASGRRPPLHYDPPEHTSYRRLINPVFRPDRLRRMHAVVDAAASELVAALRARGGAPGVGGARYEDICGARGEDAGGARYEDAGGATAATSCDLYRSFCSPYTSRVVCELLNVPASLHAGLAEDMESFESAQRARDRAAIEHYNLVLYETARQVVALRLASPLDPSEDLVSALLAAPPDSSAPTDPETVAGSLRQILVAGHGAPALVIASAVAHLAMDSSLQQRWREDRSLLAAGAEEMLRLHTPNVGFARTASRDTVLAGCPIEAGAAMAVVLPAANHDPRAFGRPEEVSPGRGRDEAHVAFGYGPHRCPGSVVGREELVAALGALLAATSQIDLDGEIGWSPWPTAGPVRLPLRLAWAPPLPAAPPAPADPPAPAAPAPPAPAGHHPERRPV
ncbi:MAG TPA: cytochrome P450, partial [Acidimicrobiales bacterium]|nr:cytochrome P450 [Acidimicrobiales bacterium]